MQDAAQGFDYLSQLANVYPLDLDRIVCAGHSAGGQLAFWLAGRKHIPTASVLHLPQPKLSIRGVVALAGAVDLRLIIKLGGLFRFTEGAPAVRSLMGGAPQQFPDRYAAADPGELLPLGVPQTLIQGSDDEQIPADLPRLWAQEARKQGDAVELVLLTGAGHFDVVDPESSVWPQVQSALTKMLC
jgi:pimeloyl-ACP methyl ester carboxylesterase